MHSLNSLRCAVHSKTLFQHSCAIKINSQAAVLCYAASNYWNHTPFLLPVYYSCQEQTVHLQMGASRGQNEQSACLVWYQPLEALKPVECLPSFSVHGEVSDDNAGEEKQHLTCFLFPPFSSLLPLMSPPPSQWGPHFTTTFKKSMLRAW